uniref:Uncharacterized protein n=1 Tax=Micrurus lemniscatus lemniscatus TaxID=129467 RepID=A0A2D4I8B6_MICLE
MFKATYKMYSFNSLQAFVRLTNLCGMLCEFNCDSSMKAVVASALMTELQEKCRDKRNWGGNHVQKFLRLVCICGVEIGIKQNRTTTLNPHSSLQNKPQIFAKADKALTLVHP